MGILLLTWEMEEAMSQGMWTELLEAEIYSCQQSARKRGLKSYKHMGLSSASNLNESGGRLSPPEPPAKIPSWLKLDFILMEP